jgi:hypothetical protein
MVPTPVFRGGWQRQTGRADRLDRFDRARNIPDHDAPQAGPSNQREPSPEDVRMASPPLDDKMEEDLLSRLVQEGGVELQNYLLSQSVPYEDSEMEINLLADEIPDLYSPPEYWTSPKDYRAESAPEEIKKWDRACKEEIDGLKK